MNSLQHVISAIQAKDWKIAIQILSNDIYCRFLAMEELYDVFERFLFGIDGSVCHTIQGQQEEEELLDELVTNFLSRLCLFDEPLSSSSDPSMICFAQEDDDCCDDLTVDSSDAFCHTTKSSLIHNLCMEHKHQALRLLLRNLDPCVASREARCCTSLSVDFVEDVCGCAVYRDALFYHSPMQAAWEGFLFDNNDCNYNDSTCFDHLTNKKEWNALWKTTVYILLAFDRQPIDYNHAFSGKWNIVHAITRYGPRAPSVVMSCALKLYPDHAMSCDDVGNLPLHVAVSNCQVDYKSYRYALEQEKRSSFPSHENQLRCVNHGEYATPISMLVDIDSSAASKCDANGRLPLHLLILHQHENSKMFESMTDRVGYFTRGHHFDPLSNLKCVMDANPTALEYPEPTTGLCPFLLAASTGNHTGMLDTIFLLLTANPGILVARCSSFQSMSKRKRSNSQTTFKINPTSPTSVLRMKRVVSPEMWTCNKRIRDNL